MSTIILLLNVDEENGHVRDVVGGRFGTEQICHKLRPLETYSFACVVFFREYCCRSVEPVRPAQQSASRCSWLCRVTEIFGLSDDDTALTLSPRLPPELRMPTATLSLVTRTRLHITFPRENLLS